MSDCDNAAADACFAQREQVWVVDDEETGDGHYEITGPDCRMQAVNAKEDVCATRGLIYRYP